MAYRGHPPHYSPVPLPRGCYTREDPANLDYLIAEIWGAGGACLVCARIRRDRYPIVKHRLLESLDLLDPPERMLRVI